MKATILRASLFLSALAGSGVLILATPTSGYAAGNGTTVSSIAASISALPPALRPAYYRALAGDTGLALDEKGCLSLPNRALKACFDAKGVHFDAAESGTLGLRFIAYGRGQALAPVGAVSPRISGARVLYPHGNLTEWWRMLPLGFEQGFSLARRPVGRGKLILALAASSKSNLKGDGLAWGRLRYGGLVVTDANGQVVPATLKGEGDRVLIEISDARAVYPLAVDPLLWIEQKAIASDGQADDAFGTSVLISGNSAFIGASAELYRPGKVYVFTRSDSGWSETQELTATPDPVPGAPPNWSDFFGWTLALSGNTLLVGAPETFSQNAQNPQIIGPIGAAFIFTESNGTWTQVQQLNPSDGYPNDWFGTSVGLAGNTAVVGSYNHNATEGTAYIFNGSSGTWNQTGMLEPSDGAMGDGHLFGYSIAFDGTNLLIGAPGPEYTTGSYPQGAAYVFASAAGTWTQAQKLTASDGVQGDQFGFSVALSDSTALVGAQHADIGSNAQQGAAYVFDNSSGAWTQQQKLVASDGLPYDEFGHSVAIQGNTALVGEWSFNESGHQPPPKPGVAYEFTDSNGTWSQSQEFTASDGTSGDSFGWSVALDGTTLLIGASSANTGGNQYQGAAYFYGGADLGLSVSAPTHVSPGSQFVTQAIATNSASVSSPAVAVTVTVPASASFVSANATQGNCSEASGVVTCDFGQIAGNAGTATANFTFTATGSLGDTIENTASVAKATPALTASAATAIANDNPPVASDGTLTTNQNMAASGTLMASDPDSDPLTFSIVDQPGHGTVTIDNTSTGAYTYTPNHGFSGSDSFTFKANDGELDSNVATVSVTVKSTSSGGGGGASAPLGLGLLAFLGLVAAIRRRLS